MRTWNLLLVLVLSCLSRTSGGMIKGNIASKYLYDGKDDNTAVIEYKDGVDFKSSKAPKVIVFYSPFCGHCISYVPKYMTLAKGVTEKYPQVEFYAVSCKAHRDVCAEHTIRGYPTVHAFPANSETSSIPKSRAEDAIIKALKLDEIVAEADRKLVDAEQDDTEDEPDTDGKDEDGDTEEEEEEEDSLADSNAEEKDDDDVDSGKAKLKARGARLSNAATASNEEDSVAKSDGDVDEEGATETEEDDENADSDGNTDGDADSEDEDEVDPEIMPPAEEDDTDATVEDENDSDATEEVDPDVVLEMQNNMALPDADEDDEDESFLAPPDVGEDEESENATDVDDEDESNAIDVDDEDETDEAKGDMDSDADEESESDQDEDEDIRERWEEDSPEDEGRINGAPRGGKNISEAVKEYRETHKANGRRPGAGAQKGKAQARDMDKWKDEIAKKKAELKKRLRRGKKGKKGQPGGQTDKEGATNVMKANTPGTSEYKERMQKLLKKINKLRKKRGLPAMTNPLLNTKKSQMPLKKEVKKPGLKEKVPLVKRMFKMTEEEQLILDASLSFMAGLKYGVFMTNDSLTAKEKAALKGWLDLMSVSLPPEWGLHSLIDELNENIDFISQRNENLLSILRKHPLPRRVWSPSCMRRDSPQGFSCGMWKLLHTSTVGIAEQRGGLNLVDAGAVDPYSRIFSPADAADTIREYLAHFFGCIECRNRFLAQYDQCSFRRCDRLTEDAPLATAEDWKQLALWLWEVHNDVSVRVAHERIDRQMENVKTTRFRMAVLKREDEIKHLYPSLEQCFQCFDENGSFDEDNVFEFLEATYWSGPDVMADRLLQYHGEEGSGSGLFWFFAIIILAAIYVIRARKVDGLQRTVNAAVVTGRRMGGKKRSV